MSFWGELVLLARVGLKEWDLDFTSLNTFLSGLY
jgi:hypothetical protein